MNKNVDIYFSAHEAFLVKPSQYTIIGEKMESQII